MIPDSPVASASLLPSPPAVPPRSRRQQSRMLGLLTGTAAGLCLGYLGMQLGGHVARSGMRATIDAMPPLLWLNVVVVVLAGFLVIGIHEAGHLVGGFSQRFRFMLFVVGPLRIARDPNTKRVVIGWNRSLALAGGVAAALPTDDQRLVERMRWLVAGGPLASVLLAACCLALVAAYPTTFWSGWALLTGVISAVIAVVTLIPMRTGTFLSDGKRLLQLLSSGPTARRDAALLLYTVRDEAGVPVSALPRTQLETMLEPADESIFELVARTAAYLWLTTQGELAAAREQLARGYALSHGLPALLEAAMTLEVAFTTARYDGDAAAARALIAPHAARWSFLPESERLRCDAAIAVAEGRHEDAQQLIATALQQLDQVPAPLSGSLQWSRDRLREMQAAGG